MTFPLETWRSNTSRFAFGTRGPLPYTTGGRKNDISKAATVRERFTGPLPYGRGSGENVTRAAVRRLFHQPLVMTGGPVAGGGITGKHSQVDEAPTNRFLHLC